MFHLLLTYFALRQLVFCIIILPADLQQLLPWVHAMERCFEKNCEQRVRLGPFFTTKDALRLQAPCCRLCMMRGLQRVLTKRVRI